MCFGEMCRAYKGGEVGTELQGSKARVWKPRGCMVRTVDGDKSVIAATRPQHSVRISQFLDSYKVYASRLITHLSSSAL
jgi:hypothetical protein